MPEATAEDIGKVGGRGWRGLLELGHYFYEFLFVRLELFDC